MVVRKAQGPDSGVGLVVVFEAGDNLLETWTVKQVEPGQRVVYDVSFAGQFTVERTSVRPMFNCACSRLASAV